MRQSSDAKRRPYLWKKTVINLVKNQADGNTREYCGEKVNGTENALSLHLTIQKNGQKHRQHGTNHGQKKSVKERSSYYGQGSFIMENLVIISQPHKLIGSSNAVPVRQAVIQSIQKRIHNKIQI